MRCLRLVSLLALLLLLQACAHSPPTRYYVLQASDAGQAGEACRAGRIGLGDVQVPAYLGTLPVVQRRGAVLERDEYQRWAEPLADGIQRVMLSNLAGQLPGCTVLQPPWTRTGQPDWKLSLQVLQLEAVEGRAVQLQARWTLLDAAGKTVQQQVVRDEQPLPAAVTRDARFAAIAAAHSELLARLSAAVGAAINALPAKP